MSSDRPVRLAAMAFLEREQARRGDVLPWRTLTHGFRFEGRTVCLIGARGIWKPAALGLPISISTAPPDPRRPRPYEDQLGDDGFMRYKYFGTDSRHPDNEGIRQVWRLGLPLIYFLGIEKGLYLPAFPVVVVGDEPHNRTFLMQVSEISGTGLQSDELAGLSEPSEARKHYLTVAVRVRAHQQTFRARVLRAYREHCAICRLRHRELLEAAHIIPDRDPRGVASVTNGLSLCKLHHAAYDTLGLGITPDGIVQVRPDILEEEDGPMLQHGLQGVHGQKLLLPSRVELRPRREFLAERFELFRKAQ